MESQRVKLSPRLEMTLEMALLGKTVDKVLSTRLSDQVCVKISSPIIESAPSKNSLAGRIPPSRVCAGQNGGTNEKHGLTSALG